VLSDGALRPDFDFLKASSARNVLIAVSGGGDSIALADLYVRAWRADPSLPKPIIATIDHGLRTSFTAEAALAKRYADQHSLPWVLRRWEGAKPVSGVMAAARAARYHLLSEIAVAHKADCILLGHTKDDAAETAFMRAMRGAHAPAMASQVLYDRRVMLVRPLLKVSRSELRQHLMEQGISFADDPSNADTRFERVRARNALAAKTETEPTNAPLGFDDRPDNAERAAAWVSHALDIGKSEAVLDFKQGSLEGDTSTDAQLLAIRYLAASLGGFENAAPLSVAERVLALTGLLRGKAYSAQHSVFQSLGDQKIRVIRDPRHAAILFPPKDAAPFMQFCPQPLAPLATAIAEKLDALPFQHPLWARNVDARDRL
jgi:tRNA(Ile)-lysidine synthase